MSREDVWSVVESEGLDHVVVSEGRFGNDLRCHLPDEDDPTEPRCPYKSRAREFEPREFHELPLGIELCRVCDPDYDVDYGSNGGSLLRELEGRGDRNGDDEDDVLTIPESNGGLEAMLQDAERRRRQLVGGERE